MECKSIVMKQYNSPNTLVLMLILLCLFLPQDLCFYLYVILFTYSKYFIETQKNKSKTSSTLSLEMHPNSQNEECFCCPILHLSKRWSYECTMVLMQLSDLSWFVGRKCRKILCVYYFPNLLLITLKMLLVATWCKVYISKIWS